MSGTWAIVVAAGRGSRIGTDLPKQYLKLGDTSILALTLDNFFKHPNIDGVLVVIHADDIELFQRACSDFVDKVHIAYGGATRQESVLNGLQALESIYPNVVLVHDAARPFTEHKVITDLINASITGKAAIAASPVVDSLKQVTNNTILNNIDRNGLWHAQTPQAFPFDIIRDAHLSAEDLSDYTDDASVAEACGHQISIVTSGKENFKITTPEDLVQASMIANNKQIKELKMESRTGFGYDVHCFEKGDHVTLCGVDIPHTKKLKGHSDADVGLHALTDAILGALCEGDIGTHFPPSDPQWKGALSNRFLIFARDRVLARQGKIIHVDVTLVCEKPKIGPNRELMVAKMAEILDIAPNRVSIKATTSEKLGFTGREEGIAAQAVATIQLPSID
ncbi:bifunctional 2-C-methyl-D-erythritol 4-phosphate cytidylyltransferase/2-C-methyl-D-erythritol 2,4-cyclodiphosphate synthase [Kiloniella sp. EL199]|uniref:bifunctional 2-C-methyl-D-erythritol 4-phosphate cytidylyltransferase/2-C-methyl-D-erythritol 2,4-cyclodiphosphate synthase n=1 Tax=Kiloniella sp. EL199 TaxID=2107581 RepID=UPI000EA30C30|nr:bifunctional 2-C-methyl-D-erythritol 4-phosphate cytidylyltransferase/2-C-methyl-D-erythritol 2,4-cyclodiphosphate synthase [Kiloniella sp. EL199]